MQRGQIETLKNVLYYDCCVGFNTVEVCQNSLNFPLKCTLHLNKADKKETEMSAVSMLIVVHGEMGYWLQAGERYLPSLEVLQDSFHCEKHGEKERPINKDAAEFK